MADPLPPNHSCREPSNQGAGLNPVNTWRTETIDLTTGKVWAYFGNYLNSTSVVDSNTGAPLNPYYALGNSGGKQINCYQPLSWWLTKDRTTVSPLTCAALGPVAAQRTLPWFLSGECCCACPGGLLQCSACWSWREQLKA